MKLFNFVAVLGLSLAAVACGPTAINTAGSAPPPIPVTVPSEIVPLEAQLDEKLLAAAEVAYNAPAYAYVTADAAKQLSPAIKAQAKTYLTNAYQALQTARTAYALKNALSYANALANASNFAALAASVLSKANH